MQQVSQLADEALNRLSRDIGKAEAKIAEGTEAKNTAWQSVFDFLDEFDTNARFIANDGFTITRQVRQGSPKLNEDQLSMLLQSQLTPAAFRKLWNSITVTTVSPALMENAIRAGKLAADIVNDCITVPEPTSARVRRAWTKDDREKAVLFGVEVVAAEEEGE